MKTIGLLGGMSWASSIEYYRLVNEMTQTRLGGLHSAKCLLYSFDFDEIAKMQRDGAWDDATEAMVKAAQSLERAGADCLVICANTMHKMADVVQAVLSIPLLHIADVTAAAIQAQNQQRIGLMGTMFTMREPFYSGRLHAKFGMDVITPNDADKEIVHRIIYDELVRGIFTEPSREQLVKIIVKLQAEGAEGVILGCTELPLIVTPSDSPILTYDTTYLHAQAAVDFALAESD